MARTAKKLKVISPFDSYIEEVQAKFWFKQSREHAYRPALQYYVESVAGKIEAINDAARIECGAPDFIVLKNKVPVGYIEAKDINVNLSKEENSAQIQRYHSLGNLILTDYLEFRWYVDGKNRLTIRIGETKKNKIIFCEDAEEKLHKLFYHFLAEEGNTIKSAGELAHRLAITTTSIRDLIIRSFDLEDESDGWLHRWLRAFSEVLIDDLDKKTFADMFSQTLTYGFFAAKVHHKSKTDFSRFSAAQILPKTNPFLRKLFAQFIGVEMPDTIIWAVDEVVELLKRSDMESILKDFGANTGKNDWPGLGSDRAI